jgi:hypothetical protein
MSHILLRLLSFSGNMARSKLRTQILAVLICMQCAVYTQHVQMSTDSLQAEIGNPFKVYFKASGSKPDSLQLDVWHEAMSADNILNCSPWQAQGSDWLADATLIFFDSGRVALPPLRICAPGSDSIYIHVYPTALPDSVQLAPIKDIIEAPPAQAAQANWWLWLAACLAGCLLAVALWKKWRKRKPLTRENSVLQPIPQDIWNQRFSALQQLIPAHPQKPYYDEISALLRNWLEFQYHIPALERTTSEIMEVVATKPDLATHQERIAAILRTSDLVKFASAEPELHEQMSYWRKLEAIVAG